MHKDFRSSCMIASALDLIGDKWSLLIVRDMLMFHKKTFKEMAASKEGVATNLLSGRLKLLESIGVISKQKLAGNKKENVYLLSEKGIALTPLLIEVVLWSNQYVRPYHAAMDPLEPNPNGKAAAIEQIQNAYKAFVNKTMGQEA